MAFPFLTADIFDYADGADYPLCLCDSDTSTFGEEGRGDYADFLGVEISARPRKVINPFMIRISIPNL